MSYTFGQPVSLSINVTDSSGAPANATAVVCTITLPDGTTSTPTVSNPNTGTYTATYTATLAGLHRAGWVATGSNASAFTDSFTVDPPLSPSIVGLAEVRAEINETSHADDAELAGFIAAATAVVVDMVGPVAATQVTGLYDGGASTIVLRHAPIVSVDTVVEYRGSSSVPLTAQPLSGGVFDGYGYTVNLSAGLLHRQSGGYPARFASGLQNVSVTYTCGRATVPANIRMAVLDLIRVNWRPQRSGGPSLLNPGNNDNPDLGAMPQGFYIPETVRQMLAPDMRPPRVG